MAWTASIIARKADGRQRPDFVNRANRMIHSVKDLSPDQRLTIESLLGHPVSEEEQVSVSTVPAPPAPEWLRSIQRDAGERGLDRLTSEEMPRLRRPGAIAANEGSAPDNDPGCARLRRPRLAINNPDKVTVALARIRATADPACRTGHSRV
jgi:hypothetical protein